jgi:hypothetical protein
VCDGVAINLTRNSASETFERSDAYPAQWPFSPDFLCSLVKTSYTEAMSMLAGRLAVHFARCAVVANIFTCMSSTAQAAIRYSGVVNISIPSNTNGVYINVVTGVTGSSSVSTPGWTINPWGADKLEFFVGGSTGSTQHVQRSGGGAVANLTPGTLIGPSPVYGGWSNANLLASITGNQPFFLNASFNQYGFRFMYQGAWHYGWATIRLSNSLIAQPRTLVDYAWEDQSNMPIWDYLEPLGVCCTGTSCVWTTLGSCLGFGNGIWIGSQTNCTNNPCACLADISPTGGNGVIDIDDLVEVINHWGICAVPPPTCTGDIDRNTTVNIDDLLRVITSWGSCN